MGKKNKTFLDYREGEVVRALGVLPLSGDFMPKYFIEDEQLNDSINPETIDELIERTTAEDIFEENQFKKTINDMLDSLTPRESKILRLRYGINYDTEYTLEQIGSMFDCTKERIRQIEAKALRKMRHPSRSDCLRGIHYTLWEQANEPMPERDMEWGWLPIDEERYQKHVEYWQERVGEAANLLKNARVKLKEPIYKGENL
jgi:RNA polymerase sigma factor (sigma-70 family)